MNPQSKILSPRRRQLSYRATIERFFSSNRGDGGDARLFSSPSNVLRLNQSAATRTAFKPAPATRALPSRIGIIQTTPVDLRCADDPQSQVWCCSIKEAYSRLALATCFSLQRESHATNLDLLNKLSHSREWIPDVLFLSGTSDCPMFRVRRKLPGRGGLIINGFSFLPNSAATAELNVQIVDILHFPLDLSFAYVRVS